MNIERFTDKAREVIREALENAKGHSNSQIEPEHVLDALFSQDGGVVQQIIQKAGGNIILAKSTIENEIARLPHIYASREPTFSPRLPKGLEDAWQEMNNFKDEYLSVEHLLLALF